MRLFKLHPDCPVPALTLHPGEVTLTHLEPVPIAHPQLLAEIGAGFRANVVEVLPDAAEEDRPPSSTRKKPSP